MLTGRICVIGRGRWGSSLLAALRSAGQQPFVVAGRAGLQPATSGARNQAPRNAWLQAQIFWLCVPDDSIEAAAKSLVKKLLAAGQQITGRIVLHSSGAHNNTILHYAKAAGAQVGCVHPLMSFPTHRLVSIKGVPFAVESARALRARLLRLVRLLGGEPFSVSSQGKALYHASAVLASPLLVSLATAAQSLALDAGLTRREADRLLQPIMQATLHNFFGKGGPRSFSGPFARGDVATISLHLQALQAHPLEQDIYRSLAVYALETLPVQNKPGVLHSLRAPMKSKRERLPAGTTPSGRSSKV